MADLSALSLDDLLSAAGATSTPDLVQPGGGATMIERAKASFLTDPQAQLRFYRRQGYEDVRAGPDGVEIKQKGQWHRANPAGLDLGDLAGMAGDVPEIAGGIVGAIGGGTVAAPTVAGIPAGVILGAGAGTAAGNVFKQQIGEMVEPQDMSLGQRATEVGKAGALGLATEFGGGLLTRFLPKGRVAAAAGRSVEGMAPGRRTALETALNEPGAFPSAGAAPYDQTLAQATGSPSQLANEARAARREGAADQFAAFYEKQADAIAARIEDLKTRAGENLDPEKLGKKLDTVLRGGIKEMYTASTAAWKTNMAKMAEMFGDAPVVAPTNTRALLEAWKKEGANTASGAMEAAAEHHLSRLPDSMNIAQLTGWLKESGRAGYGKVADSLLPGLGQTDKTTFAKQLNSALKADVDAAIESGSPAAWALKQTRDQYAKSIGKIDFVKNQALMQILGDTSEAALAKLPGRILSMPPSLAGRSVSVLEHLNPELAGNVRRQALEKYFQAGVRVVGPNDVLATPKQAVQSMEAILGSGDKTLMRDLNVIRDAMRSYKDRGPGGISPTAATLLDARTFLSPTKWIEELGGYLTPQRVAKWSLDPSKRAELMNLMKARGPTARATRALTYLAADEAGD